MAAIVDNAELDQLAIVFEAGGGPPYNYDIKVQCGQPGTQACSEGAKYISWDGIHFTEAANAIIASKIHSTAYSTPNTPFDFFCHG